MATNGLQPASQSGAIVGRVGIESRLELIERPLRPVVKQRAICRERIRQLVADHTSQPFAVIDGKSSTLLGANVKHPVFRLPVYFQARARVSNCARAIGSGHTVSLRNVAGK